MNNRLIMLPQPILVSDEKIEEGDFMLSHSKTICRAGNSTLVNLTSIDGTKCYKIIAGIEGLPKIDLSLIAEEIGWVDVEKLAESHYRHWYTEYDVGRSYRGFIHGFKTNQSLNEKKYTLADMEAMCAFGMALERFKDDPNRQDNTTEFRRYIEELSKPKEYNVEVEMQDKIALDGHTLIGKELKITNNTIKVTKIIK